MITAYDVRDRILVLDPRIDTLIENYLTPLFISGWEDLLSECTNTARLSLTVENVLSEISVPYSANQLARQLRLREFEVYFSNNTIQSTIYDSHTYMIDIIVQQLTREIDTLKEALREANREPRPWAPC